MRTQGVNFGTNYYRKKMTYAFNYSYNKLVSGEDDPIIPAFNTPLNKFNVSFTGHDMKVPFTGQAEPRLRHQLQVRRRLHLHRLAAVQRSLSRATTWWMCR